MTSKLVVNTIEADTGISSVSFASSISMSSTSKFHFGDAGIDIGADTNINRPASGVLGFNINSSEKARIDSNGDLNLGNNPTNQYGYRLNIEDSSQILYAQTASSGGTELKLYLDHGNTIANFGTVSTSHLAFVTSNTEKLRILSDGKVGIGTVNPSQELTVYGADPVLSVQEASASSQVDIGTGTVTGYINIQKADGTRTIQLSGSGDSYFTGGRLLIGTTTEGHAAADDLTIATSGSTGITIRSGTSSEGNIFFSDATSGDAEYAGFITYDHSTNNMRFTTNATERLRLTSGGQVVQYTNHTSGTSAHMNTGWYGDDANHYTLEYKDFNEIRAVKTLNSDTYSSIVYKREMMTEYCDIEFTLKGNAPSGTDRHTMFVINGDGSDTFSNYDRLVFRYRPGDTSGNQIRLDKGGGGTGFSEISSSVPNFFDGNERHVHIQIRKRTFSITVNRMGQSEYNYNARNSADLVSPRGYFGFSLYERSSHGTPEVTIRDFKITNYTQNALPAQSVAFQAEIASNVSKSSGQVVKPANNEIFDNGYGGNYNTSNYRFTAPVAGMYQFSNTHNVYSSPGGQWAGLKVNGTTLYVGNKINSMPGSGDHNMTCYAIIQLQPGDYVEAIDYTNNSQTYSGSRTWNRFEGSLIAAFK